MRAAFICGKKIARKNNERRSATQYKESFFFKRQKGENLGYIISQEGIKPQKSKE